MATNWTHPWGIRERTEGLFETWEKERKRKKRRGKENERKRKCLDIG